MGVRCVRSVEGRGGLPRKSCDQPSMPESVIPPLRVPLTTTAWPPKRSLSLNQNVKEPSGLNEIDSRRMRFKNWALVTLGKAVRSVGGAESWRQRARVGYFRRSGIWRLGGGHLGECGLSEPGRPRPGWGAMMSRPGARTPRLTGDMGLGRGRFGSAEVWAPGRGRPGSFKTRGRI